MFKPPLLPVVMFWFKVLLLLVILWGAVIGVALGIVMEIYFIMPLELQPVQVIGDPGYILKILDSEENSLLGFA